MSTAMEGPTGAAPRLTPPPPLTLANPSSPREASPSPAPPGGGRPTTLSPSMAMPPHGLPLPAAHGHMFPFFKTDKPVYNCSPQAASCPENNTCKLIEFRGAKLAAFNVDGRELICLPQAFELFLKHLVGGLHTVYTKLKRLDITPVVCNVEQVRVLRGLGAIQPGVNRCKLIAPKEFDVLYDDCTNASSRPGRPPKRSSLMSSPDTVDKLKKSRMEPPEFSPMGYPHNKLMDIKKSPLFANGYHYPPQMAPLPFLPLGHPAMMNLAMANHLSGMRPDHMMAMNQNANGLDLTAARNKDRPDSIRPDSKDSPAMPKPLNLEAPHKTPNGHHPHHPALDRPPVHSPSMRGEENRRPSHDDLAHLRSQLQPQGRHHDDMEEDDEDYDSFDASDDDDEEQLKRSMSAFNGTINALGGKHMGPEHREGMGNVPGGILGNLAENPPPPGSSLESLLLNILSLMKVAAQNARNWEQQVRAEKAELKMQAAREKELRDKIERQLQEQHKVQGILQKKLKKERKMIKHLREQLDHNEHSQPRSGQPHFQMPKLNGGDGGNEEQAPKMTRMPNADEGNSDGEHSTCSSDAPSPSESWRDQPAFPHPIPAPMTSEALAMPPHFSMEMAGLRGNRPPSREQHSNPNNYMMVSSKMAPHDSPGNVSPTSS